jgi:hypothetical protein
LSAGDMEEAFEKGWIDIVGLSDVSTKTRRDEKGCCCCKSSDVRTSTKKCSRFGTSLCEKCSEYDDSLLYSALNGLCRQCASTFKERAFRGIYHTGTTQNVALLSDFVVPGEIQSLAIGASGYDDKVFKELINGKVFFIITIPHMKI